MRTIEIKLGEDEELIRLYATRGRRHYIAVIESEDRRYRIVEGNAGCTLAKGVTRLDAIMHVESQMNVARKVDGIHYAPIETSCALINGDSSAEKRMWRKYA